MNIKTVIILKKILIETSNFHTALVNKIRFLYMSIIKNLGDKMNETEADDGQLKILCTACLISFLIITLLELVNRIV